MTNIQNWNDYRRQHLTPNGWRHDSPGVYVNEDGAEFHPYEPVVVDGGTVEQWRVLADLDRAPDPDVGHIERPRKLAEEVTPA